MVTKLRVKVILNTQGKKKESLNDSSTTVLKVASLSKQVFHTKNKRTTLQI